ncbi:hypothetical protein LCGC14_0356870 [marine sediment metagenome]|uniref:Uncharacterized protein n=1 Tax=marine sediment metagenome TaxID=412755 RepID=A0A0F9WH33_9ZZZZ
MGRSSTLTRTPPKVIGDVVRELFSNRFNFETKKIQTGQNLAVGDVCQEVSSEMLDISAAVNEVQTITIGGTHTGGTLFLHVPTAAGEISRTVACAWSATEATMTATIQAALDTVCGSNGIVLTEIANTAAIVMVLTFSGTGFAGKTFDAVDVDDIALTGTDGSVINVKTTTGKASGGNASAICLEDPDLTVDEVQNIVMVGAGTDDTYTLTFMKESTGAVVSTTALNHDDALSVINTAIDVATGNTSDIVATGDIPSATGTLVLTFSGGEYAGKSWRLVTSTIGDLTGVTSVTITRDTTGGGGEALFAVRGPLIVAKDQLDYNSQTEANADAALKALGIVPIAELTVSTQTT